MRNGAALVLVSVLLTAGSCAAQDDTIRISNEIYLIRISSRVYVHVSYSEIPPFGLVGSNGVIFVNGNRAFLFDTPASVMQTKRLVSWLQETMGIKIVGFVPNHWHGDCMAGLEYLDSIGIESYGNLLTNEIAAARSIRAPRHAFSDSMTLKLGDKDIFCYYPGPAHTIDNIVVWLPSDSTLFAGCMVKELAAPYLGNTVDGDTLRYAATIQRVIDEFPDAKIVVPGHGRFGGPELLRHTKILAEKL